jgi:hypothetical protein
MLLMMLMKSLHHKYGKHFRMILIEKENKGKKEVEISNSYAE